jgi:hypothetical protein
LEKQKTLNVQRPTSNAQCRSAQALYVSWAEDIWTQGTKRVLRREWERSFAVFAAQDGKMSYDYEQWHERELESLLSWTLSVERLLIAVHIIL